MPASTKHYSLSESNKDIVICAGAATVGAANAVTSVGFEGQVEYVSAGLYTLTFPQFYPELLYCDVRWEGVAGAAINPALRHPVATSYVAATGVLTISFLDESTGAVHASGLADGEKFYILCVFKNSIALPPNS